MRSDRRSYTTQTREDVTSGIDHIHTLSHQLSIWQRIEQFHTRARFRCCATLQKSMSGLNLNAITSNATRFGVRLQETISEHARDLAISRGASATYFDAPEDKLKQIRTQLDSNSDREKLDAMKRLIAVRPVYDLKFTQRRTSIHDHRNRSFLRDATYPSSLHKWSRMLPLTTWKFVNLFTSISSVTRNMSRTSRYYL